MKSAEKLRYSLPDTNLLPVFHNSHPSQPKQRKKSGNRKSQPRKTKGPSIHTIKPFPSIGYSNATVASPLSLRKRHTRPSHHLTSNHMIHPPIPHCQGTGSREAFPLTPQPLKEKHFQRHAATSTFSHCTFLFPLPSKGEGNIT